MENRLKLGYGDFPPLGTVYQHAGKFRRN